VYVPVFVIVRGFHKATGKPEYRSWFDVPGSLTAQVPVRFRLHVRRQMLTDSGPTGLSDAKPFQLRGRLSDALGCRGQMGINFGYPPRQRIDRRHVFYCIRPEIPKKALQGIGPQPASSSSPASSPTNFRTSCTGTFGAGTASANVSFFNLSSA
jgi:hypothetical protein